MHLWGQVIKHASGNKMDARNLALMLSPNIFHSPKACISFSREPKGHCRTNSNIVVSLSVIQEENKLDDMAVENQDVYTHALQLIFENMAVLKYAHASGLGSPLVLTRRCVQDGA